MIEIQADALAPGAGKKLWKSNAQFFAKGENRQRKERWSSETITHFELLCASYPSDYINFLLSNADL